MGYPEKVLANDEQVVEHLHPHWITLVPATLWFLLICGLGGVGIAFAPDKGTMHWVVIIAIIVVGFALLCWLTFAPWLRWRTTHYVFTTHRVLIRTGILRHEGRDIALPRINDVGFSQSLWERIVRAGTLTIESAGEHGQSVLRDVPRSNEVQQLLNRLIDEDSNRRQGQAAGYQQQGYQQGPPQQGYQQGPPQDVPRQDYEYRGYSDPPHPTSELPPQ